jgi:predicted DNA-binding protein with PD1-like motif
VVHAHGVVGLEDGTTRGGHIISATVWPTLEWFLTDEPGSLVKEEDPATGLLAASLVACIHRLRLPILQDYQAI